jgi:hypothetical protein
MELTGPRISSGYASRNPPLKALVTGLLTAARTTTSFGDFCEIFRAAVRSAAIFYTTKLRLPKKYLERLKSARAMDSSQKL